MYETAAMGYPPDYFSGVRTTVMGLGLFGGQLAVIRFLVGQGAIVTVTDIADCQQLKLSLEKIKDLPVTLHLGGHIESDFVDTDLVVVSPAVPKTSRYLRLAMEKGITITTEMNLFLDRCPATLVGITGTTGKSTTTAMIGHILGKARQALGSKKSPYQKVWVGGNIGRSLLEDLPRIKPADLVVLELSSFQLEDLGRLELSPHIALVTNVRPNHLDRHVTMDDYLEAKSNITRFQEAGDILITNLDDELSDRIVDNKPEPVAHWRFCRSDSQASPGVRVVQHENRAWLQCCFNGREELIYPIDQLPLPGRHNVENTAAAVAVASAVDIPAKTIAASLKDFTGLPDRLEFVAQVGQVKYYNDSKATTPDAGTVALDSFSSPVVVIIGGYDKSIPLDNFARHLAQRAKAVICIGQTGPQLAQLVAQHASARSNTQITQCSQLIEAVEHASRLAVPGDVVLLSPGCSSWDMFENYQQRGQVFKQAVDQLAGRPTALNRA